MAARSVLLSVSRPVEGVRNALNEPTVQQVAQGTIWAGKVDLNDQEILSAGQVLGVRMAEFTMRANAMALAITNDDVLTEIQTGVGWKVTGAVENPRGRRREVAVRAVARSDRGAA